MKILPWPNFVPAGNYFLRNFVFVKRNLKICTFNYFTIDKLLKSGHDVSDGGLITCLLEMAFAGNCGMEIDIPTLLSGKLKIGVARNKTLKE